MPNLLNGSQFYVIFGILSLCLIVVAEDDTSLCDEEAAAEAAAAFARACAPDTVRLLAPHSRPHVRSLDPDLRRRLDDHEQ